MCDNKINFSDSCSVQTLTLNLEVGGWNLELCHFQATKLGEKHGHLNVLHTVALI